MRGTFGHAETFSRHAGNLKNEPLWRVSRGGATWMMVGRTAHQPMGGGACFPGLPEPRTRRKNPSA